MGTSASSLLDEAQTSYVKGNERASGAAAAARGVASLSANEETRRLVCLFFALIPFFCSNLPPRSLLRSLVEGKTSETRVFSSFFSTSDASKLLDLPEMTKFARTWLKIRESAFSNFDLRV